MGALPLPKGHMRTAFLTFLAALVLLASGCASVPMAGIDQDTKAKNFVPAPTKASIYIYRNENFGAAISMAVTVNGMSLGETAAKTYFMINVLPGAYVIDSQAEGTSRLPLSVINGKNYFIWQEVKMGILYAGSMLQQVSDDVGQAGVRESKLIAAKVADNLILPIGSNNSSQKAPFATDGESVDQRLRALKSLSDSGLITPEVYLDRQRKILEGSR